MENWSIVRESFLKRNTTHSLLKSKRWLGKRFRIESSTPDSVNWTLPLYLKQVLI